MRHSGCEGFDLHCALGQRRQARKVLRGDVIAKDDRMPQRGLLMVEPLGWDNIEQFLKLGPRNTEGQKGCFAVSSIRELAILPPAAIEMLGHGRVQLKQLIAKNIEAEKPKADINDLAGMVLTFFTGLSLEQNLKSSRPNTGRKVDNLMRVLRRL